MTELPEVAPLGPVWPVRPDERAGRRKPKGQEPEHRRAPHERDKAPRDDDHDGRIDEYA